MFWRRRTYISTCSCLRKQLLMDIINIPDPIVRAAIKAMNTRNRQAWFDLFAPDAVLTDDGNPHDFTEWSDSELFGSSAGRVTAIDHIEDDGKRLFAQFHSDQWGDFPTSMQFTIAGNKITRLDVATI